MRVKSRRWDPLLFGIKIIPHKCTVYMVLNKNYGLKAINFLSLACKPLTLFWPNSHLTSVILRKKI